MKIELVLLLYDALIDGSVVARRSFCAEHGISERTFYRYIHAVSEFLRAHKSKYVVDISERTGQYFIKGYISDLDG